MGVQKKPMKGGKSSGISKKGGDSGKKSGMVSKNQNSKKLSKYNDDKKTVKVIKNEQGQLVQNNKLTENVKKTEKYQKEKILNKKERMEKEGQSDVIEHFDKEGFFVLPTSMQVSAADEEILKQFSFGNNNANLNDIIQDTFQNELVQQKEQEYKENILLNPKVKVVYSDIAKLLKTFRSGKLARAFKIIPQIEQWQDVLELTKPEEWTPQAMNAATKCFASNLDPYRAKIFFETYLTTAIRKDIQKHKKLNCHYYFALQKALYKPAAWFKGILFAIICSKDCTLKEAQIIGSVLAKMSIPSIHSSVAILKLSQFDYTGPIGVIMKVLVEKKYSLPLRVIQSLVEFFLKFKDDERTMPVVWHQLLLRFCQLYNSAISEQLKQQLKKLVQIKKHHLITVDIIKAIDGVQEQKTEKIDME